MMTTTTIDETQAWQQLQSRDHTADFLYAVLTTGVFCRPACSSRLPLRQNTRFYASTAEARAAGFRPCQRCKPEQPKREPVVARMCAYLEKRADRPVRLAELGKLIGMSPFTAQRLFKQTMCVTPSQYQRTLRANAFRDQLKASDTTVTTAIYEAGYSSSSRAYEQSPLGMTPGRFLAGGRGETIRYAVAPAQNLDYIIVATTERGICWLALGESPEFVESSLRAEFPAATLLQDDNLAHTIGLVLQSIGGAASSEPCASRQANLPIDLRGTAFQLRVWQALQQIPSGETRTYSQLAAEMGIPRSTRAVARACALNRVSVLVPCHRVVGVSGSLTGYRWGIDRKRQLLAVERPTAPRP